ncbi:riboflavin-specific deaminase [Aspergillus steynii IBT 23096]|uniref:2,5-diamino-6-ribosylamino-4(3H)-pyrimidinone 5'-phosphate reductase n=1 Tax=Aspergillus steynii IBT 23096 TaxID=1392250 RepID=A0A2I2GCD8_9EURO|nr:riboflavin-specific deaminase [Aspergillus steynii IBT 23096]PLB50525.1 riboflavin-specific deaminase [Aspergillus steynii IBT 23096]
MDHDPSSVSDTNLSLGSPNDHVDLSLKEPSAPPHDSEMETGNNDINDINDIDDADDSNNNIINFPSHDTPSQNLGINGLQSPGNREHANDVSAGPRNETVSINGAHGSSTTKRSTCITTANEEDSIPNGIIHNPPNLARIRQVMFECKDPIEINLGEFETYWPFIDNVWVKQRSNSSKEGHCTTDYYMCRLRRPTHRTSETRPLPEGKRPRKKRVREGGMCNFQIKVVRFEGAYSTVTIARTPGSSHIHSHNLDYIDKVKRNSGLMEFARKEAVKGYLPSSIYTKFREESEKLVEAGGKFCTVTDVRNVSAKWRIQNPEVKLMPHDGYEYQKGHGIVRTASESNSNDPGIPAQSQANAIAPLPPDTLPFPQFALDFLSTYLPNQDERRQLPHVTLSYASSLDSKISLQPGMQTVLSGPEAKLMTHYLRSRHDAILIGVGTVLADNPGLNCRLEGAGGFGGLGRMWQPRPVVIDPTGRWPINTECRMLRTAVEGKGKAPWVIVSPGAHIHPEKLMMLKGYGGDFLRIVEYNQHWRLRWEAILRALASEGVKSIMIEGGGTVLRELLNPEYTEFIDSIIVTVAPTYLGSGGVGVSPDSKSDEQGKPNAALNPRDVKWTPLGQNVIMCGKIRAVSSAIPDGPMES